MILKTLAAGQMHGYAIAQRVKVRSDEVLEVGESSLYPALQRLLLKWWVTSEWGASVAMGWMDAEPVKGRSRPDECAAIVAWSCAA